MYLSDFGFVLMSEKRIEAEDYFLPCLFCGDSDLEIIESLFEDTELDYGLTVYCSCGAQGPAAKTEDEALLKWNGRFKS
jgi:Lar family restriction alleviation protein